MQKSPEPTKQDHKAGGVVTAVGASTSQSPPNIDEDTPRSWTWAMTKLKKLVTEAKGAATSEIINFVKTYLMGTKLILVVGKAGTGKTTILAELTGLPHMKAGETLKRGTKEYQVCPTIIDDEQYLFVDTAGFGDPDCDDLDCFRNTVSCIIALGSFVQIVGVLVVLGSPGTRLGQQDAKILSAGFWDSYSKNSFKQAFARMGSLYDDELVRQVLDPQDPTKRYHGAQFYHHGVTGGTLTLESWPGLVLEDNPAERKEELRGLIRRRYAEQRFKPVKLQFKTEVENGIPFFNTEAAKVLRAPAVGVVVRIENNKCVVQAVNKSSDTTPPPLQFADAPQINPTTWSESIMKWYDLTVRLARYFREARQQEGSTIASSVKQAWNNVRAWWSGSSDEA